jgi:hypothetical protein
VPVKIGTAETRTSGPDRLFTEKASDKKHACGRLERVEQNCLADPNDDDANA